MNAPSTRILEPQEIKYVVHPRHGVSAGQLMRLYGVPQIECVIADPTRTDWDHLRHKLQGFTDDFWHSLTHLYVRSSGDYTLP